MIKRRNLIDRFWDHIGGAVHFLENTKQTQSPEARKLLYHEHHQKKLDEVLINPERNLNKHWIYRGNVYGVRDIFEKKD